MENTCRTCTIESLTPMDLLVIGREDFLNIFINVTEGNEPEHITFCRYIFTWQQGGRRRYQCKKKGRAQEPECLFKYWPPLKSRIRRCNTSIYFKFIINLSWSRPLTVCIRIIFITHIRSFALDSLLTLLLLLTTFFWNI